VDVKLIAIIYIIQGFYFTGFYFTDDTDLFEPSGIGVVFVGGTTVGGTTVGGTTVGGTVVVGDPIILPNLFFINCLNNTCVSLFFMICLKSSSDLLLGELFKLSQQSLSCF
jgi:hypothetical protein